MPGDLGRVVFKFAPRFIALVLDFMEELIELLRPPASGRYGKNKIPERKQCVQLGWGIDGRDQYVFVVGKHFLVRNTEEGN